MEVYGNYIKIYLEEEMILSYEKIFGLEELLFVDEFLCVYKFFIVVIKKIKMIEGNCIFIEEYKILIG